jgi:hypothetical protein
MARLTGGSLPLDMTDMTVGTTVSWAGEQTSAPAKLTFRAPNGDIQDYHGDFYFPIGLEALIYPYVYGYATRVTDNAGGALKVRIERY